MHVTQLVSNFFYRVVPESWTVPGRQRQVVAGLVIYCCAILLFICITAYDSLVYDFFGGSLWMVLIIFLTSLFAFSFVAALTFDSVRVWRAVDYPWVFTAVVAVVMTVVRADYEIALRSRDYHQLLYRNSLVNAWKAMNDFALQSTAKLLGETKGAE